MRVENSYPHSEYLWVRDECPSCSLYSPLFIKFSIIWFNLIVKSLLSSKAILHHREMQGNSTSTLISYEENCTSWALSSRKGLRVENSYPHSEYLWVRDEWPSCSSYSPLFIDFSIIQIIGLPSLSLSSKQHKHKEQQRCLFQQLESHDENHMPRALSSKEWMRVENSINSFWISLGTKRLTQFLIVSNFTHRL